jgi:hypothetical protein
MCGRKLKNWPSDCQQKRQQRCWKGAGLGSGGVVLDSSAKSRIFRAETTLKATDSDPRLHTLMRVHQWFRRLGCPMANSLANNFWIPPKLFQYSGRLSRNCLTAGICFELVLMTHEHETALSPFPPS